MKDDHKPGDENPGDASPGDKRSGYKRPPGRGRFKPGVSGNPRGRPKGSRNLRTDFDREMNANVDVRANGKPRRVRTLTAILMRLKEMAIKGDMRAISKTLDTAIKLDATAGSEDPVQEVLSDADKEIISDFLRDAMPNQVAEQKLAAGPTERDASVLGNRTSAVPRGDGLYRDFDARMSAEHPLRRLRLLADAAIAALDAEFNAYATNVRPSVSPDKLVRAWLLRMFYTIATDVLVFEELDYNPVYRWFVGIGIDEPAWTLPEFTKALDFLRSNEVISRFWRTFLANDNVQTFLLSDDASFSMLTRFAQWHGYIRRDEMPQSC